MKKRVLSVLLCLVMLLGLLPTAALAAEREETPLGEEALAAPIQAETPAAPVEAQTFAAGDSEYEPIQIATAQQLADFATEVNNNNNYSGKFIKLTADIDLSTVCGADVGGDEVSWTPIGRFKGTFDGAGHKITNLYINDVNGANWGEGLFETIGAGGTVKNLGVSGTISGSSNAGGIASYCEEGTIENCYNECTITSTDANSRIGGVVGDVSGGTIRNCCNRGAITGVDHVGGVAGYIALSACTVSTCYNTGTVTGSNRYAGGVVGYAQHGTVSSCYNTGRVSGVSYVGGIAGEFNNAAITNCYNTGAVTGSKSYVGGVVGQNYATPVSYCYSIGKVTVSSDSYVGGVSGFNHTSTIRSCYYLAGTAAGGIQSADEEGQAEAKAADQFKEENGFSGWDFTSVWNISYKYNPGRPILRNISEEPAATPSHTHPVCGAACGHDPAHADVEWTAWSDAAALPSAAGNYYLTTDVALTDWVVPADVNLCLNGHTIKQNGHSTANSFITVVAEKALNLCDCTGGGTIDGKTKDYAISTLGELSLYGGVVIGGNTGVRAAAGGTFQMHGGSVENSSTGVSVEENGTFLMDGGAIAANEMGVVSGGTFRAEGNVVIAGNASTSGAPKNVVMYDKMELSGPLGEIAQIGLGLYSWDNMNGQDSYLAVQGYDGYTITEDDLAKLSCDSADYTLQLKDGKVYITKPAAHTHAVSTDCSTTQGDQVTFHALTSENGKLYIDGEAASYNAQYTYLPSGNYYLGGDVAVDTQIHTQKPVDSENYVVNLCLNGHELKYVGEANRDLIYTGTVNQIVNICDCAPDGGPHTIESPVTQETVSISGGLITGAKGTGIAASSATVNLYGGTIAGNFSPSSYGGGVVATHLAMYGGAIAHNVAPQGGGVHVTSDLTMTGGAIRHNWANGTESGTGTAGGIDASFPVRLTLSGDAVIADNLAGATKTPSNVYLESDNNSEVRVDEAGLGQNARIGVTKGIPSGSESVTVAVDKNYRGTLTQNDLSRFFSDSDKYQLKLDNGAIVLKEKPATHTHSWATAWSSNANGHWHACTATGCTITDYATCGETGAAYGAHVYDNDQDATCNTCGYEREISHDISGTVTDHEGNGVENATVKLMQGSAEIATATTDDQGSYSFSGVPAGLYNVVAEKDGVTKTILVKLTDANAAEQNIQMPEGKKNSVVEITGDDTPAVVVGGVDAVAEAQEVAAGQTVTITLTVEAKDAPTDKTELDAVIQGKKDDVLYLDLSLLKTTTQESSDPTTEPITDTVDKVLEIAVDYDFTGKKDVTVYRKHGDNNAEKLTALSSRPAGSLADGSFYADSASGVVYIYASKFSTYAIGYTAQAVTPSPTPSRPTTKPKDEAPVCPFVDVTETDWCYESVKAVYESKLMEGTDATHFSPAESTTRATIATIIWRMAGSPAMGGGKSGTFPDVPDSQWYTDAVEWAASVGVVKGYDTGDFGPDDPITREQLALMLWRYAGGPATNGDLTAFTDADSVSGWVYPAMEWAVERGILTGKLGGVLDPQGQATRAEVAAMLERYCQDDK